MKQWKVGKQEAGMKLVAFLHQKIGSSFSSRKIKQAIENNLCLVNGKVERFASIRVRTGDKIQFDSFLIDQLPPKVFEIEANRILYEDDALLFYDKPSGLVCDEEGLGQLFSKYEIVHRLDRDTAGVVMLAKSLHVKENLIALFRELKVKKSYLALVDGTVNQKKGTIENYIGRISDRENQIQWGIVDESSGKLARTDWEMISQGKNAALIRCYPVTGRTHQIRLHLKEIGYPILGDFRYERNYRCPVHVNRCLLHAEELKLPHPISGEPLQVKATPPEDFKEVMEKVLA